MSTAAGLALLSLITQIEAAGHTRVLMLDDCPDGLPQNGCGLLVIPQPVQTLKPGKVQGFNLLVIR